MFVGQAALFSKVVTLSSCLLVLRLYHNDHKRRMMLLVFVSVNGYAQPFCKKDCICSLPVRVALG